MTNISATTYAGFFWPLASLLAFILGFCVISALVVLVLRIRGQAWLIRMRPAKRLKKFFGENDFSEKTTRNFFLKFLKSLHDDARLCLGTNDVAEPPTMSSRKGTAFDIGNSILLINEVKIKINRRRDDNNQHKMLNHIFKDSGQEYFFSEIAEEEFGNGEVYKQRGNLLWKTYYRACQEINRRVLEEARVENFLICSTGRTGRVRINPDYLAK